MLSHIAAAIATTGIMFTPTADPDRPFPYLPASDDDPGTPGAHEFLPYNFPINEFPGWLLVARDPHAAAYYDEDARAIDETNWDVIAGDAEPIHRADWYRWTDENVTEAWAAGALLIDGALIVAPLQVHADQAGDDTFEAEHRTRVAGLITQAEALADYLLLDEGAYSEREHDAWCEFAADGLRYDTTRDLTEAGADPDTIDAVDDAWSTLWPLAARHLTHTNGFTGEHAPEFHHCIARAVADALARIL